MQREPSFDFVRAVCTLGVILFHFSVNTASNCKPLEYYWNGAWGDIFVGMFFILSGYLLYRNDTDEPLGRFYHKRWKAIFPPFYIGYILCLIPALITGKITLHPWKRFIPTLMGMDGLVNIFGLESRIPTAYLIGEWFLGAIILCYIPMPALLRASRKFDIPILALLFIPAYVLNVRYCSNICAWLFYMQAGIIMAKRDRWRTERIFMAALFICFFLNTVEIPRVPMPLREMLMSVMGFIVLAYIGGYVMRDGCVSKTAQKLSKWSFCAFLLHHVILDTVLGIVNPTVPAKAFCVMCLIVVLSVSCGALLNTATKQCLAITKYAVPATAQQVREKIDKNYNDEYVGATAQQAREKSNKSEIKI